MRKMQGGGTVRTWDIPPEAERLSYYIRTNGRPLKALVELVRSFCNICSHEIAAVEFRKAVKALHLIRAAKELVEWMRRCERNLFPGVI